MTIRDTLKYQLMPDMSPPEFEALKADIAQRGVVLPIDVDESGEIIDGHHALSGVGRASQERATADHRARRPHRAREAVVS
jgi:ParB-like nuclease domain